MKYDVSCKKLHFFTFEVQGQLSKEKQTISVTSMKLHFITSEVQGQIQGQLSKVSKAKNFGDLYFHENTLQAAQKIVQSI